jgi:uncharacterized membrane protein YphA (DoxX/SURF4 family)
MNLGRLIARAVVGGLFVGHGTQKLFGWFGGPGRQGTASMMDKLELRPGQRHALAAGTPRRWAAPSWRSAASRRSRPRCSPER